MTILLTLFLAPADTTPRQAASARRSSSNSTARVAAAR
jgi:hypothetical protein